MSVTMAAERSIAAVVRDAVSKGDFSLAVGDAVYQSSKAMRSFAEEFGLSCLADNILNPAGKTTLRESAFRGYIEHIGERLSDAHRLLGSSELVDRRPVELLGISQEAHLRAAQAISDIKHSVGWLGARKGEIRIHTAKPYSRTQALHTAANGAIQAEIGVRAMNALGLDSAQLSDAATALRELASVAMSGDRKTRIAVPVLESELRSTALQLDAAKSAMASDPAAIDNLVVSTMDSLIESDHAQNPLGIASVSTEAIGPIAATAVS